MKTILIVEDLAVFREPLDFILRNEGYQTRTAANGAEALAVLSERAPDLILLDLCMPVMDGIEFLERVRSSPRFAKIPVIIFSEVGDKLRVMKTVKLGISGYLLKAQFSMKDMLERLRETLREAERAGAQEAPESGQTAADVGELPPGPVSAAGVADSATGLGELRPIATRAEVLRQVGRCEQLKALAPTVSHVLKLTANAHCSVEAVSKAIAQDHAIALKILKLANSAVYTRGEPVDSVQKAVVRIGIERIRQAVLNIAVMEKLGGEAGKHIDMFQFWEHAIATGLIAAELAHGMDPKRADAAFTMGLLHDVGRIIFAEQLGAQYAQVVQTAQALELPLEQVETRMLVANHAEVMEHVLQAWKFARDLAGPIMHHHLSVDSIRVHGAGPRNETARLALANRIAHALVLGTSGNDAIYPMEDLCQLIDLDPLLLEQIIATTQQRTDDMKFAMLSSGNASAWPERREQLRERFAQPFRPLFAGPRPQFDAYRIFCRQFVDDFGEAPNISIVHIPSARDRAAAARALRAEETSQGVRLPLVVLSPGGRLGLDQDLVQGRPVAAVPTPLYPGKLVAAVNAVWAAQVAIAA